MTDHELMLEAIALAEQGLYTASPNPRVGCIIVQGDKILGRGFHAKTGEAHAEVNAINDCGDQSLIGTTAYVTLEPCSHRGHTGPCCEALLQAGIAKVVVAMQDPNPQVAGKGIKFLEDSGVEVVVGVAKSEAQALNPGFIQRMAQSKPWVRLKVAQSLDGRTAMANGESQWITGPQARADVQQWRARSCAIVSGAGTVNADDPSLTVRAEQLDLPNADELAKRQPLRVIVSSGQNITGSSKVFTGPGASVLVSADVNDAWQAPNENVELKVLADANGRVDLAGLMQWLAQEKQVNEVLVEAGAKLAGALEQAGLIDEYIFYVAPVLMGSTAKPVMDLPLVAMSQRKPLQIMGMEQFGEDWRIIARPK